MNGRCLDVTHAYTLKNYFKHFIHTNFKIFLADFTGNKCLCKHTTMTLDHKPLQYEAKAPAEQRQALVISRNMGVEHQYQPSATQVARQCHINKTSYHY